MLSFIHLSDIHFHKYSGDAYDIDHDLRCEIIRDISYEYRKKISTIDGNFPLKESQKYCRMCLMKM